MTASLPELTDQIVSASAGASVHDLQLDGTKIGWYRDRVEAWMRGEKIAPITMDVAWTRQCNAACSFCVFPDTPVMMADGSLRRMVDVHPGDRVASVDGAGNYAISEVLAHWQTSPSMRGLHIETQFGNLKCTANHPVLTDRGWILAGDLRVGDLVKTASHDRGRETVEAREVSAVLGCGPARAGTEGKASPSAHRLQQDEDGRAAFPRSAEAIGGAADEAQQDAPAFGGGTPSVVGEDAAAKSCREDEARTVEGRGKGATSRPASRQRSMEEESACLCRAEGGSKSSDEGEQSNEGRVGRRQDAAVDGRKAWTGFLVALVQAPVERRTYQGASAFGQGEEAQQRENARIQSDAKPGSGGAGSRQLHARATADCLGTYATDMEGGQDYARHVQWQGQREGGEQDRASTVSDAAVFPWQIRRGWDVLDQGDGQRDLSQPGFYLRERQDETRATSPWNVLASSSGNGVGGDRGLSPSRMACIRDLDEAAGEMDDATDQGSGEVVVGFGRIVSIRDAGYSPVYDLECYPHHNFVAGGIVVHNCYAQMQANDDGQITQKQAYEFLEDAASIGVKGVSLISDGESTVVPWYEESIEYAASCGLKIGVGTNGVRLKKRVLERILPHISYLRFNFSAGELHRYKEIMGLKERDYFQVIQNVKDAMEIVRRDNLPVNVNMQMVTMPDMNDQIIPLARLAKELRPHYLIYKHCADNVDGFLGVDYRKYDALFDTFREAEAMGDEDFRVVVKWSRLADEGKRDYQRCYGPPFILQMSGSGLIAPCGFLFNSRYQKFHIGNITKERFRDIFESPRYWDVLSYLASSHFDAQRNCGPNCLQTNSNSWLDKYVKGQVSFPTTPAPPQMEFL